MIQSDGKEIIQKSSSATRLRFAETPRRRDTEQAKLATERDLLRSGAKYSAGETNW